MPGCYLQLCKLLKSVNHCDIKYVSVKISGMSFSSADVPAGYSNKNKNDKKGKRTGAHRSQHDCCSLILSLLATQSGLNEGHKKDARRTQEK